MSRQTLVLIASIFYVALQIILVICSSSYSTVVLGFLMLQLYIGGHSTGLDSFIPNIKIQIILSCPAQFLCCNARVSLVEFSDCSKFVWPN